MTNDIKKPVECMYIITHSNGTYEGCCELCAEKTGLLHFAPLCGVKVERNWGDPSFNCECCERRRKDSSPLNAELSAYVDFLTEGRK